MCFKRFFNRFMDGEQRDFIKKGITIEEPTSEEPTNDVPISEKPTNDEPTSEGPNIDVPISEEPTIDVPATDEPTSNGPKPQESVNVPNAKCGSDYCFAVESYLGQSPILSVKYVDDEGDLLLCEDEPKSIKGKPSVAREWWMEVELPDRVYRFQCYVNADPRTLWKNIPSDQKVKSDKDYKAITTPYVDIIAVSYRGRSHANTGKYRDDDYFIEMVNGMAISVVADGAGSAEFSSTGSKLFCQSTGQKMVSLLTEKKDQLLELLHRINPNPQDETWKNNKEELVQYMYDILPAAALYGKQQLVKLSEERHLPLKKFHTTALLTFVLPISDDFWFCASFQVGDGLTVALSDNKLTLLGVPDKGSFPGETVFVTSDSVFNAPMSLIKRVKICFCHSKPTIVSVTDGVTDSYFADLDINQVNSWQKLLSEIQNENGKFKAADVICDWLDYYTYQEHDDKTMVIIQFK